MSSLFAKCLTQGELNESVQQWIVFIFICLPVLLLFGGKCNPKNEMKDNERQLDDVDLSPNRENGLIGSLLHE